MGIVGRGGGALLASVLLLASSGGVAAGGEEPDFAGTIVTRKMIPASGTRTVLAILWDPKRPDQPAPDRREVEEILFGKHSSVADWFRENSGGRLSLKSAGVLGWYPAAKPAEHYWTSSVKKDAEDRDGDGWLNGHVEKWAEAIFAADKEFDFAKFDGNKDGVLQPAELGVLVVIPQKIPFGTNRGPSGREHPQWKPLVVDGVKIPVIAEWYSGIPTNLGAPAHELCHFFLGSPDLYFVGHWPFAAGDYSLMDHSYTTAHLDPFQKLKLGWVHPTVVEKPGVFNLRDVETRGECLLLHSKERGPQEYFLLENRWRGASYDAGRLPAGVGIPMDGLAIWHVLEDPKDFDTIEMPTAGRGEWGRRGIRIIRANGGTPFDDRKALFTEKGARIDDDTKPAALRWFDGKPTGMEITLLSEPGTSISVRIRMR